MATRGWTTKTLVKRLGAVCERMGYGNANDILFNPGATMLEEMTAADLIVKLMQEATLEAFNQ